MALGYAWMSTHVAKAIIHPFRWSANYEKSNTKPHIPKLSLMPTLLALDIRSKSGDGNEIRKLFEKWSVVEETGGCPDKLLYATPEIVQEMHWWTQDTFQEMVFEEYSSAGNFANKNGEQGYLLYDLTLSFC